MKCAFVGEKDFNIIKMHGTTIKMEIKKPEDLIRNMYNRPPKFIADAK
jgi:hypothetical protein